MPSEVGVGRADTRFHLTVSLYITQPNLGSELVRKLIADAHAIGPYSNAMSGNIEVNLHLR